METATKTAVVAVILMVLGCRVTFAYDFESGGFFYNLLPDGQSVEVTAGDVGYTGVPVVPATVNYQGFNRAVVRIGDNAFEQSEISNVFLPSTIVSIGNGAFSYAEALENITLPQGLKEIAENSFAGTAIRDIAIPRGVTAIGEGAFQSCLQLQTVFIPATVTEIADYAFNDCEQLREIYCATPSPAALLGKDVFTGDKNVDLIVLGRSVVLFAQDSVWNENQLFSVYPAEEVGEAARVKSSAWNDGVLLELGNDLCYKIYVNDELIATTAARYYYLPSTPVEQTLTVVPTNYFEDADAQHVVWLPSSVKAPGEKPGTSIYAHEGTIYIEGDNYGKPIRIYDGTGNLCYAQKVTVGQIDGLKRGQVYIVVCGGMVKKLRL